MSEHININFLLSFNKFSLCLEAVSFFALHGVQTFTHSYEERFILIRSLDLECYGSSFPLAYVFIIFDTIGSAVFVGIVFVLLFFWVT